jgi:hypothetical protein
MAWNHFGDKFNKSAQGFNRVICLFANSKRLFLSNNMTDKIKLANYTAKFPFILFYQGDYKESPTLSIINIVEKHFELLVKKNNLKTLIYLLVESIQNIERYSAHIASSEDFSFVYSDGNFFYIITQNMIHNSKIEELTNRLNTNSIKNKEELDETYKTVLSSETRTEKGGGLGLIDIARKSRNNLFYSFDKKSDDYSTYALGFSIPIDKNDGDSIADIAETETVLNLLKNVFSGNKSTLFYGGDFSNSFIKALIELLKTTKINEANSANKKTHHLLIELIQNVKRHAFGINNDNTKQLILEWKEHCLEISTYNLLKEEDAKKIGDKIEMLNASDKEALGEISKKQLTDFTQSDGLGLIDIASLIFPEKIQYQVLKKDTFISELILTIHVNYES